MSSPSICIGSIATAGAQRGPTRWAVSRCTIPHVDVGMVEIMDAHMISVPHWAMSVLTTGSAGHLLGQCLWQRVALYRMSNGATVRHAEFRRIGHPERESFRLFGTEASFVNDVSGARWTDRNGWTPLELDASEPLPPELADNPGGHGGSHAYLVHEYV